MEILSHSLAGGPAFLVYLLLAAVITTLFVVAYIWVTPHAEFALIRANNTTAAVALGGTILGFVLPLASAIAHSDSIFDCALWGLIALIVQILVFFGLRVFIKDLSERINQDQMATGILVAAISICSGILNAACMTN